ncbi:hypothetical protein AVEN_222330-1 [Araneus ventricosus]|uniref:ATP-dependent DNA helicase n=1 Tax=Araneus ventricosus TaxID=182803 RepID=A0A4Y2ERX4_ARAVE|nr:hypothetical protein AVEN_222330-1 [Araneus ventricosus]
MPKCFFLDGPAGTGKTFVYSTLLHAVRGKGDQAIAVASTGIAATLLSGGRTAHSIFKIPLTLNATSTCNLKLGIAIRKTGSGIIRRLPDQAPVCRIR